MHWRPVLLTALVVAALALAAVVAQGTPDARPKRPQAGWVRTQTCTALFHARAGARSRGFEWLSGATDSAHAKLCYFQRPDCLKCLLTTVGPEDEY